MMADSDTHTHTHTHSPSPARFDHHPDNDIGSGSGYPGCPCTSKVASPTLATLIRGHHANHLECLLQTHPHLEHAFTSDPRTLVADLIGTHAANAISESDDDVDSQHHQVTLPSSKSGRLGAVHRAISLSYNHHSTSFAGLGDTPDQALDNAIRHAALALVADELDNLPPLLTGMANSLPRPVTAPPEPVRGLFRKVDPRDFPHSATDTELDLIYPIAVAHLANARASTLADPMRALHTHDLRPAYHHIAYSSVTVQDVYLVRATLTSPYYCVIGDALTLLDARRVALYHLVLKSLHDKLSGEFVVPEPAPAHADVDARVDGDGDDDDERRDHDDPSTAAAAYATGANQVDPSPHRQDLAALQQEYVQQFTYLRTWPLAAQFPLATLLDQPNVFLRRVMQLFKIDAVRMPQGWYRATGTTYSRNYFGDGDSESEAKRAAYVHLILLLVKGEVKNKHYRNLLADARRGEWERDRDAHAGRERAGHDREREWDRAGEQRNREWDRHADRERGWERERERDGNAGRGQREWARDPSRDRYRDRVPERTARRDVDQDWDRQQAPEERRRGADRDWDREQVAPEERREVKREVRRDRHHDDDMDVDLSVDQDRDRRDHRYRDQAREPERTRDQVREADRTRDQSARQRRISTSSSVASYAAAAAPPANGAAERRHRSRTRSRSPRPTPVKSSSRPSTADKPRVRDRSRHRSRSPKAHAAPPSSSSSRRDRQPTSTSTTMPPPSLAPGQSTSAAAPHSTPSAAAAAAVPPVQPSSADMALISQHIHQLTHQVHHLQSQFTMLSTVVSSLLQSSASLATTPVMPTASALGAAYPATPAAGASAFGVAQPQPQPQTQSVLFGGSSAGAQQGGQVMTESPQQGQQVSAASAANAAMVAYAQAQQARSASKQ